MTHSWQSAFYEFCKGVVRLVLGLFFRARAYGQHNLPREGGALLLSNHQSFLDPLLVGAGLPRPLTYMARDTLFRNPLFGAWLRLVNAFPVRRGRPDTTVTNDPQSACIDSPPSYEPRGAVCPENP